MLVLLLCRDKRIKWKSKREYPSIHTAYNMCIVHAMSDFVTTAHMETFMHLLLTGIKKTQIYSTDRVYFSRFSPSLNSIQSQGKPNAIGMCSYVLISATNTDLYVQSMLREKTYIYHHNHVCVCGYFILLRTMRLHQINDLFLRTFQFLVCLYFPMFCPFISACVKRRKERTVWIIM